MNCTKSMTFSDWQGCQQHCQICKKFYVTVIFKEIGILNTGNEMYEKINKNKEEILQDNLEYNKGLKQSNGSKD